MTTSHTNPSSVTALPPRRTSSSTTGQSTLIRWYVSSFNVYASGHASLILTSSPQIPTDAYALLTTSSGQTLDDSRLVLPSLLLSMVKSGITPGLTYKMLLRSYVPVLFQMARSMTSSSLICPVLMAGPWQLSLQRVDTLQCWTITLTV